MNILFACGYDALVQYGYQLITIDGFNMGIDGVCISMDQGESSLFT